MPIIRNLQETQNNETENTNKQGRGNCSAKGSEQEQNTDNPSEKEPGDASQDVEKPEESERLNREM